MLVTLLGIDLGTSSVKVVRTGPTGAAVSAATAAYGVTRPHAGWAETDPEDWWRAVVSATLASAETLDENLGDPVAIGLSGQMHGVVLCTADGTPVRPAVLWADSRAEPELERYRQLPAEVAARLANPLSPGMAGPILAWLHAHEPSVVAAARYALQPKDWLRARLTGRFLGEPSDASATLLYDVLAQDWAPAVVGALGLRRELLPELLPAAGSVAGTLTPEAAAQLGLTVGIPVAAGAADTAAAALGGDLLQVGTVQLTIGTGVQLVTPVPAPTADTLPKAVASKHLYRAATADGWYAMAASLTGGQTLDWVRRMLGLDWAQLYATAARGPRSGDPVFLPHLVGERTPYLDTRMRGAWAGLDGRHDRDALTFAALEGVAFAAADAFDALGPFDPAPVEIRLAGGGTLAPAWRQLVANCVGTPLRPVDVPGASARGAALLAAAAAGLPTPAAAPAPGAIAGGPATSGLAAGVPATGSGGSLVTPVGYPAERRALYWATLEALRPNCYVP